MARSAQAVITEAQRKRSRGLRLSPEDVRAIYGPIAAAEAQEGRIAGIEGLRAKESQRQFNENLELQKKQLKAEEGAATIKGAVDLATTGITTYKAGQEAGWWGSKAATDTTTGTTTGTETATGAPSALKEGATVGAPSAVALEATRAGVATAGGAGSGVAGYSAEFGGGSVATSGAAGTPVVAGAGETATAGAGTYLAPVGAGVAGGAAGGYIGQKLTKAGEPGHMGGEKITGGAIGASTGAAAGWMLAGMAAGPVGWVAIGIGALVGGLGGSGEKVICTELNRQGYMSDEMLHIDHEFKYMYVDDQVYAGYYAMAMPIVRLMRKSKIFTQLVRIIATPWSYQMCHMVRPYEYKENKIGKIIMKVGFPLCRWKGKKEEKKCQIFSQA